MRPHPAHSKRVTEWWGQWRTRQRPLRTPAAGGWILAALLGLLPLRAAVPPPPLIISEIMYHPMGGDAYQFIELANTGSTNLDLFDLRFTGISYQFTTNTLVGPGQTLVLCSSENPPAFQTRTQRFTSPAPLMAASPGAASASP